MILYILLGIYIILLSAIAINFAIKSHESDEEYKRQIKEIYSRKRK